MSDERFINHCETVENARSCRVVECRLRYELIMCVYDVLGGSDGNRKEV